MKYTSMLSAVFFFVLAISISVALAEVGTTVVQVSGNLDSETDLVDLPRTFAD